MIRSATTDQNAGVTSNYSYDPIYELAPVTQATTTTENYTRDSFGNQGASTGSLTNSSEYPARESDSETGLYQFEARYDHAASGRSARSRRG